MFDYIFSIFGYVPKEKQIIRYTASNTDYLFKYHDLKKENSKLKTLLAKEYNDVRDMNYRLYVNDLEEKVKTLKREVRTMQEIAEFRNAQMRASNYIVKCTGCWAGGPSEDIKKEITLQDVDEIYEMSCRLKTWYSNMVGRKLKQ